MHRPRVLVVAGFDPSGGAGVTADLAVLAKAGVRGVAVATALTLQGASGVERVDATEASLVERTIRRLADDGPIDAVKIGMLARGEIVEAVDAALRVIAHGAVVLDPVLASGTGFPLLDDRGCAVLRERLLRQVDVVTPNAQEAARLGAPEPASTAQAVAAARALLGLGTRAVLLKGGHLPDAPDDVWWDHEGALVMPGRRIGEGRIHGAGCALSSWLAGGLALGLSPRAAARRAKAEVAAAIERAVPEANGVRYLSFR
ncbi:MAG: hydroxymethylpyrimidine/phosphomethylpyrimidine kinase [Deltaproteobacteria bacterium]|nr:hydroxymethylpyrimidine/phosphomethylpyrimidine kinase [Deltaproteobacteria bacterium]